MEAGTQTASPRGTRPRIFYGWWIVAAGMAINLWVSIAWIYGIQIFLGPILREFGWSRALLSGAFALQRLEGSVVNPIEGFLLDWFGPRRVVMVGIFITGLGLISMSFMNALWMFYVSVLIVSLGMSTMAGLPRNWAIVQWFKRLRGRALGIGASGPVLAGPLLIIIVWLVEAFGWRTSFQILGVATWIICLPLAFAFRSKPEHYGYLPDGDTPERIAARAEAAAKKPKKRPAPLVSDGVGPKQAMKSRAFWLLVFIFGAHGMGTSAMMVHLVPYFESIQFSSAEAASVLGFFTVLSVFGRIGGGWAIDYFDRRIVLAGLLIVQATAFIILLNITSYWQVAPFALLYGTSFGAMIPSQGATVSAYFGSKNFGAIQGLLQSCTVVTGMIAPVMMGRVFDVTGSYAGAITVLIAVGIAAIPLTFFVRPPTVSAPAVPTPA